MHRGLLSARSPVGMVGRQADLDAIGAAFAAGAVLVTVLGPPGVGKTRLAEAFASGLDGQAPVLVDLTSARGPQSVRAGLAYALGAPLRARTTTDDDEALGRSLRRLGPVLVVCDNAEVAREEVAVCASFLARVANEARFLVTSRTRLGLPFERVYELEPLALGRVEGGGSPAAQLFEERARAAGFRGAFAPAIVDTIVRKLDGLPLAIELAAPWLRVLSPEQLADQLDRRLELLASDAPRERPSHRRLRAALDEAVSLLGEKDRDALVACAAIAGTFDLAAATAVMGARDEVEALGALQALRDHSLITSTIHADTGATYGMLDAIRRYARERFADSPVSAAARRRHAEHFCSRTSLTVRDIDDVAEAVLASARQLDRRDLALRGATRLASLLARVGPVQLGCDVLDVAITASHERDADDARAWIARARLRRSRGRFDEALADLGEATTIAQRLALDSVEVEAVALTGQILAETGRAADAASALARVSDKCTAAQVERRGEAALELLGARGIVAFHGGDFEGSLRLARDLVLAAREHGDRNAEARGLMNVGAIAYLVEAVEEAAAAARSAAELYERIGDVLSHARALSNAGFLAFDAGRTEEAREMLAKAIDILERCGDSVYLAAALAQLAAVEIDERHGAAARELLLRALSLANALVRPLVLAELGRAAHSERLPGEACDLYARALAREGGVSRARIFAPFAIALAQRGEWGDARDRAREATDTARATGDRPTVAIAEAVAAGLAHRSLSDISEALSSMRPSADVRFMRAVLSQEPSAVRAGLDVLPSGTLGLDSRTLRLRLPNGDHLDLATKGHQRRLIDALVENRIRSPGAPLSVDDLLTAGWPGERVLALAGANRVYVAMSALRRLGLRGYLVKQDGGYLLSPELPVTRL